MLNCIAKLKHRSRPKPKRNNHPWKMHSSDWFKSRTEPYFAYQCDGMNQRIKKSMKKGTGPMAIAC